MSDEYLWDRTGAPDPSVAALERVLSSLRFDPLPIVAVTADRPAPVSVPRRARWWSTSATVAASVAAALLVWWWGFVAGRGQVERVVVERVPVAAPPTIVVAPNPPALAADEAVRTDADEAVRTDADEAPEGREATSSDGASAEEPATGSAAETAGSGEPPTRRRATKTTRPGSGTPRSPGTASVEGSAASSRPDVVDVDCIIDPSHCNRPRRGPDGEALPHKLSTADIRAGVEAVKPAAKRCGPKHGATPGTRLKVKMSISGETGRVTSSVVEPPLGATPLGRCVAAALAQARFPRFSAASVGAVYPITM
jgi:hypothetical protein